MLNSDGNEWVSFWKRLLITPFINSESPHLLCLKTSLLFSFQTFPFLSDFELVLLILAMDSLNTQIKSNILEKKPGREKTIPFKKHVILTVTLRRKFVCAMDITPAQYQWMNQLSLKENSQLAKNFPWVL